VADAEVVAATEAGTVAEGGAKMIDAACAAATDAAAFPPASNSLFIMPDGTFKSPTCRADKPADAEVVADVATGAVADASTGAVAEAGPKTDLMCTAATDATSPPAPFPALCNIPFNKLELELDPVAGDDNFKSPATGSWRAN